MIECLGVLTAMVALLGLAFAKRVLLGAGNGKPEIVGPAELKILEEVSRPNQYSDWEDQFREASVESAHRLAGNNPADAWKVWGCCCPDCSKDKEHLAKLEDARSERLRKVHWLGMHADCVVNLTKTPIRNWADDNIAMSGVVSCETHGDEMGISTQVLRWLEMIESKMKISSELTACDLRICELDRGHGGECSV